MTTYDSTNGENKPTKKPVESSNTTIDKKDLDPYAPKAGKAENGEWKDKAQASSAKVKTTVSSVSNILNIFSKIKGGG